MNDLDDVIAGALNCIAPRSGFEAGLAIALARAGHGSPARRVSRGPRPHHLVLGAVAGVVSSGAVYWTVHRIRHKRAA